MSGGLRVLQTRRERERTAVRKASDRPIGLIRTWWMLHISAREDYCGPHKGESVSEQEEGGALRRLTFAMKSSISAALPPVIFGTECATAASRAEPRTGSLSAWTVGRTSSNSSV